ncbi:MAG: sialidase family protein, partial [Dokdonella sp.]
MQIRSQKWVLALSLVLLGATASFAAGPDKDAYVDQIDDATIVQSQGVDQRVDYVALRRFGPWDDRNYALTQADVAVLPANDEYRYGVPAFFKILKRKESIQEGFPIHEHYPRELDKEFDLRFGGLLQDGVLHRRGLGIYSHPDPANPPENLIYATDPLPHAVPINGENFMAIGDEETSIKYNPVDPLKIIAGSNSPSGGQAQNYSLDGGATWLSGGNLPSTCCDPAMEWSADGTIAYAATLTSVGGSFRAAVFRSINNGQTWAGRVDVSTASSDKEYIHVDKSSTSPFLENVYLTWHQGNVMFFSRSLDKGLTWSTPISFSSAPLGIGSDITTDKMGNIYYIWPSSSTSTKNVYMVKSTDGGATFAAPVVVQPLFDVYDFPIPAMETRNAFIYIAADTDRSTGPHAGRVYAAYTAMHPSSGNAGAATNHAWIQVAFSDNGGATWALATTPHSVADIATIDRFHPWLEVDGQGAVHIGFYDTRNSVNRTGIDFYYNYSIDGGTTWLDETRVSSVTSPNITNGQEWGDYNGLSVGPVSAAMSWSDNRGSVQHSYVGRVQNLAAGPTYTLNSTSPGTVGVCAGQPVPPRVLSLTGYSGYTGPVAISFPGLNATVFPSATATPNPVNVSASAATSTVNLTTSPSAPPGVYPVTVQSTGGGSPAVVRQLGFSVNLASAAPSVATLTT